MPICLGLPFLYRECDIHVVFLLLFFLIQSALIGLWNTAFLYFYWSETKRRLIARVAELEPHVVRELLVSWSVAMHAVYLG